jgi:hypothetical protein
LNSNKLALRQAATESLLKVGDQAVPALQKLHAAPPTLETQRRAEALLTKLLGGALTSEQVRMVRALEVLERLDTPEARQLLSTLAGGASGAFLTREAEAALEHLGKAVAEKP